MLYYYNKYNKIVIKLLSLALSYIIEVVIGLRDIIYIAKNNFINIYRFRNLI